MISKAYYGYIMDFFSLDLGALLSIIVAFYISKQWKDQKRTEVIAKEAKEIIALLMKNQIILSHLRLEENIARTKVELSYIKDEYFNCLGRVRYLSMSITEDLEPLIQELAKSYISLLQITETKLENQTPEMEKIHFEMLKNNEFQPFKEALKNIDTYSVQIIEKIFPYSVYKKYIRF